MEIADTHWDIMIAGAGLAGAMTAKLAAPDARVLLIDKAHFPRPKVCGCCLNSRAVRTLVGNGAAEILANGRAVPLTDLVLAAKNRRVRLQLPGGYVLSRAYLDAQLVRAATSVGAVLLCGYAATLGPRDGTAHTVHLRGNGRHVSVRAEVVVAADGLQSGFLRGGGEAPEIDSTSRIGAGTMSEDRAIDYEPGTIHMSAARGGYVGLVRLEDGRLNLAAAFDSSYVREMHGLGPAARAVLQEAGLPCPADLSALDWRGTPPLTRQAPRNLPANVFAVGDAAGYVEPFTGEGMAWALASGAAVAPFIHEALAAPAPDIQRRWRRRYREIITARQRACRWTSRLLRKPALSQAALAALSLHPGLARPVMNYINAT